MSALFGWSKNPAGRSAGWPRILPWISFYNRDRLHEALGYISPVEFEANHAGIMLPVGSMADGRVTAKTL